MMYATFGNAQTGEVGPTLGPFPFAQITYDTLRTGLSVGDAYVLARIGLDEAPWIIDPERHDDSIAIEPRWLGTQWTDITLHIDPEDALA